MSFSGIRRRLSVERLHKREERKVHPSFSRNICDAEAEADRFEFMPLREALDEFELGQGTLFAPPLMSNVAD
jgi:hypothetical protein